MQDSCKNLIIKIKIMKKNTKTHPKHSTVWHFFVLIILGALIAGGTVYMFKMKEINYLEKQIAGQEIQLKNMEIAKYKKILDTYKSGSTTKNTTTTDTTKKK